MTQENASGQAVAERVRAADIAVGGNSSVEAMLANSLRERKPLADDGALYDTVQAAENAASSFVFVPPGTFNESVTIDTAGLTLLGSGRTTLIDGGSIARAVNIQQPNVTVENMRLSTSGTDIDTIATDALSGVGNVTAKNIVVSNSGRYPLRLESGTSNKIINCTVESSTSNAIHNPSSQTVVEGCIVESSGGSGVLLANDDVVVSNCIIQDASAKGVQFNGNNDSILIGCRIINSGEQGVLNQGNDNIIANNRVSGSTNADINDSGTGTTLDANLTGVAN